ncbi:MAG: OB-fold nucleic acid binding domain-containing protein [Anaerolineae bacterium]
MNHAWKTLLIFTLLAMTTACLSTGCGPASTPYPTHTPYPTYTPYPTCPPAASESGPIWPSGSREDVVSWQDADQYYGQIVTVEGTVVRTGSSGQAVFLNFHQDDANHFTAVIFPDDWPKFPEQPEELFRGRLVRITGVVQEYEGAPEIIVEEPSQIDVALSAYDLIHLPGCTPCPPCSPCPGGSPEASPVAVATVTPPASPTPPAVVSWQDAAQYYGQIVTVEGTVVGTYNSGKVVFLNFDKDYENTFKVVIFPDDWPKFPEPPEELFLGKKVRVKGLVKEYQGAPEIIVEEPEQIEVVE